ncbi:hypothetical protein D1872_226740 [compost metagenome]
MRVVEVIAAQRHRDQADELRQVAFAHGDDVEHAVVDLRAGGELLEAADRIAVRDQEQHEFALHHLMPLGVDDEMGRRQTGHLLDALHIISQLADQRLQLAGHFIRQLGQGAPARDVNEVPPVHLADVDRPGFVLDHQIAVLFPALGDLHRPGEVVRRAERKNTERRQKFLPRLPGHAVDDLVEGPVPAGRDDNVVSAGTGLRGFARGIPFSRRRVTGGFDSGQIQPVQHIGKQTPHFFTPGCRIIY